MKTKKRSKTQEDAICALLASFLNKIWKVEGFKTRISGKYIETFNASTVCTHIFFKKRKSSGHNRILLGHYTKSQQKSYFQFLKNLFNSKVKKIDSVEIIGQVGFGGQICVTYSSISGTQEKFECNACWNFFYRIRRW